MTTIRFLRFIVVPALAVWAGLACAASPDIVLPGMQVTFSGAKSAPQETATAIKILLGLTVLSLAPAILISMTSFTRFVIVLAMLRQAIGMQDAPPNTVLISLALFLTLFTMAPVIEQINSNAYQPLEGGKIGVEEAVKRATSPLKEFMVRQTREQDLALLVEISKANPPRSLEDVSMVQLIPAYMLSELKTAFQIGFVIFLPFLLIDLIISAVLMSMGMLMVPPIVISLPIKILMFVLIDGWNLVVKSLVASIH
jgi:flagellar biosynthesis protein FliP